MIDLGCAALPAPEPWLTRAVQGALEELPRTRTPTATTRPVCPRCAP